MLQLAAALLVLLYIEFIEQYHSQAIQHCSSIAAPHQPTPCSRPLRRSIFLRPREEAAAIMACTGFRHPLKCLLREAQPTKDISGFLVPAFGNIAIRQFSTSSSRPSRIGMAPISVPPDVNLRIVPLPRGNAKSRHVDTPTSSLEVTGPQGAQQYVRLL